MLTAKGADGDLGALESLVDIMKALRAEDGCPWDKEQTHQSLRRYLIEECYEVIEAIDSGDMDSLCEELGDLLLQVVFHTCLAQEAGHFDLADVISGISTKMIRRHPHIFGDRQVKDSAEVLMNWEHIKQLEREAAGISVQKQGALAGVPVQLPSLIRALKIQERAARVGFDWPDIDGVWQKIAEETSELKEAVDQNRGQEPEEIGDLLFAVVNIARRLDIEPELALAASTGKFEHRFQYMEEQIERRGQTMEQLSLADLDVLWEQAKTKE